MISLLLVLEDPAVDELMGREDRIVRSASESIILSLRFASYKSHER